MSNRPIIVFLLVNFVVCLFIINNFRNKNAQSEIITKIPQENINEKIVNIVTKDNEKTAQKVALTNVATTIPDNQLPSICMEYGPLDIEQKSKFDTLIAKEKINSLVSVTQKNQFEIYWNLGSNQLQANEMFEKQKKDVLQDKKFQLVQENGIWVVSIAVLNDNIETAKALATQLREKADKVNAGGKWQYRTLPKSYFYQVKNINAMTPKSQAQIITDMKIEKKSCNA